MGGGVLGLGAGAYGIVNAGSKVVGSAVGSATEQIYISSQGIEKIFPELMGVNPHYVENAAAGINTNCISCVIATQQRLSGVDLNAVAANTKYGNLNDLLPAAPFGFGKTIPSEEVVSVMLAAGNGAVRPLVILQPRAVQHVINVVNKNGTVYFIDAQIGKVVTLQPGLNVLLGNP